VDGRENSRLDLTTTRSSRRHSATAKPPEVSATAQRMRAVNDGRHEIPHMVCAAMTAPAIGGAHDQSGSDPDEYRAALTR
jgi:hypothetical protein